MVTFEGVIPLNERLSSIQSHWNKTADSPWYQSLRTEEKLTALKSDPASAFLSGVWEMLNRLMPHIKGKQILLPSSGDNHAALAFALLGAHVTSADISEKQLFHAKEMADALKLSIRFVCDDTTHLSRLESGSFDLVYTSNGTLAWIDDPFSMYKNIHRVLKTGGLSLMYDVHPFTRPFTCEAWKQPYIQKPYAETLPHCHWRMQDLVNAMAAAGLTIAEMAELPSQSPAFWFTFDELSAQPPEALEDISDWHKNPMAALPVWLCIAARK